MNDEKVDIVIVEDNPSDAELILQVFRKHNMLHEDWQQQLAAVKFHLGLLSSRSRHDPSLQALAAKLDQMLKDAIEKSRGLSHERARPCSTGTTLRIVSAGWRARCEPGTA